MSSSSGHPNNAHSHQHPHNYNPYARQRKMSSNSANELSTGGTAAAIATTVSPADSTQSRDSGSTGPASGSATSSRRDASSNEPSQLAGSSDDQLQTSTSSMKEPVFIDKSQARVQRTDKSCQVCRDRRVKCGREWPTCVRCRKRREICAYGDGVTVEMQDAATLDDPRVGQLQGKLAQMEKQLRAAQATASGSASSSSAGTSMTAKTSQSPSAPPATPLPAGLPVPDAISAIEQSLPPLSRDEQDTLLQHLVSQNAGQQRISSSESIDWRLARPRMGELLTFHLLDASVFACCSRIVSFKPLISRIAYYKSRLRSLTPTDEAAVAVLCALGARSSPHSAILGLQIPGLADGTAPPAVYLSVGTRRENACRALRRRAEQIAWLGGVIEGASGWDGQALGPGQARTTDHGEPKRMDGGGGAPSNSGQTGSGTGGGAGEGSTPGSSRSDSAQGGSTSGNSSFRVGVGKSRKERAMLAKEKREAVEVLCAISQLLIFDEVRPRKSRFFLRNAVGMFQDLQIDMDQEDVVELRRSVGLSLFGEDAVHSAQLCKPPLVSQADIDSHFAQTDLQLPDFDRDRLSQSLEEILSTTHPAQVSLPMLEKALWTTAIWVCYLQRTFAKLTTVRQVIAPSPLEQLQALWHQIDTTHASVQKLQNYFVNIHHTPQGAEQDPHATDHFVLLAVRADTRLVDLVFLMHGFLMREDLTSGWGLGTQAEADLIGRMRVESEMRVRKCLKLVAFYSRLYLSSEDKHVVHHLTLQMELLPNWTFMAVQTVGQPAGPVSTEFEVSNEELDWLLSALRLALFYTPLAAVRLQELTSGKQKRSESSTGTPSLYNSRQESHTPPSPWLPMPGQMQSQQQQMYQPQSQQQQQAPQNHFSQSQQDQQHFASDGAYYHPEQDYNNPALYPAPPEPRPSAGFQRQHSLSSIPQPSPQVFQAQVLQHQRNEQAFNLPYGGPASVASSGSPNDHRPDNATLMQMAHPSTWAFDAYGYPSQAPHYDDQSKQTQPRNQQLQNQRQELERQRQQHSQAQQQHDEQQQQQQQQQQQRRQEEQRQQQRQSHTSGRRDGGSNDSRGGNTGDRSFESDDTAIPATYFAGLDESAFRGQSYMDLTFTRAASAGAWGPDVRQGGQETTNDMIHDMAGSTSSPTEEGQGQDRKGDGSSSGNHDRDASSSTAAGTGTSLQMDWGSQYTIQPPELW